MEPKGLFRALCSALTLTALALALAPKAAAVAENVIHNFLIYPDGASPTGNLIADAFGNFYGTTESGGEHGFGALFQLTRTPDGKWIEILLHSFDDSSEGAVWAWLPNGGLTFDTAGNLYGTTQVGGDQACGPCGCGTVFKLTPAHGRWYFSIIYRFQGKNDGSFPNSGVVFDAAGNLYGTTNDLVNSTAFQLVPSSQGWTAKTIYSFATGVTAGNLAIDFAGNIFGTLSKKKPAGIFELIRGQDGTWTENSLCGGCSATGVPVFDQAGNLYINANQVVLELLRNQDWKMTVLAEFNGSDGSYATGALTFDESGNLYGTTELGGEIGSCLDGFGCGTAFRLTPEKDGKWHYRVIYRFKGNRDGDSPLTGVIFDRHGNIYGTTFAGGNPGCDCGTVFQLTPASYGHWKHVVINRFGLGDGSGPPSGLVADASGNLYGVMAQQGDAGDGCGMVYQLTPSSSQIWKEHILHRFRCDTGDGMGPTASLILDSAGNLYGTTLSGGTACPGSGCGTIFQLSPSANGVWRERVLYSFTGNADGYYPAGGLVLDPAGNLYGITKYANRGPCHDGLRSVGCGVVYELSPTSHGSWTETTLHTFTGAPHDGAFPTASLIFDQAGNLYGTTTEGGNGACANSGNSGCGTAFELSPGTGGAWTETVLYNFTGLPGSYSPQGLTSDSEGNLYGAASGGNPSSDCPYGCGTVYQLSHSSGRWVATVLHNFGGFKGDGTFPQGTLTFDPMGSLYGTTTEGGTVLCGFHPTAEEGTPGCGTVFQLSPSSGGAWTEHVFYSFSGPFKDGALPATGVIFDAAGKIFGTTTTGGVDQGEYSEGGTVFEINP